MRFLLFLVVLVLGLVFQEEGLLVGAVIYLGWGLGRALLWAVRAATADEDEAPEPAPVVEPGA